MDTPLVDPEGFPRADIDVAGVRTARVHIIRLRNDLRALLREMEQLVLRGLPPREADSSQEGVLSRTNGDVRMNGGGEAGHDDEDEGERPFARVDAVAPDSPAHQAVTSPFLSDLSKTPKDDLELIDVAFRTRVSRVWSGKTCSSRSVPSRTQTTTTSAPWRRSSLVQRVFSCR